MLKCSESKFNLTRIFPEILFCENKKKKKNDICMYLWNGPEILQVSLMSKLIF